MRNKSHTLKELINHVHKARISAGVAHAKKTKIQKKKFAVEGSLIKGGIREQVQEIKIAIARPNFQSQKAVLNVVRAEYHLSQGRVELAAN